MNYLFKLFILKIMMKYIKIIIVEYKINSFDINVLFLETPFVIIFYIVFKLISENC